MPVRGKMYVKTAVILDKFANIKKELNDCPQGLESFLEFFVQYLPKNRVSPGSFLLRWDQAFDHIRQGRKGWKEINHPLVGESGLVYFNILSSCGKVMKVVFPPELAEIGLQLIKKSK